MTNTLPHAPFIPQNKHALDEQFETQLEKLLAILGMLQGTVRFNWIDESILRQIRERWELARDHAAAPDNLRKLIGDFSRAAERGESSLRRWLIEFGRLAIIRGIIEQTNPKLEGLVSSVPRWIVLHRQTALKNEEARLESSLRTIETELLAAYSPFGEAFGYYTVMLKRQKNQRRKPASQ